MEKKLFHHELRGYFDLSNQNKYFGGWNSIENEPGHIAMAFPVEGSYNNFAVVVLHQDDNSIVGEVYTKAGCHDAAFRQGIQNVSADVDGMGWPDVGTKDRVIGELQKKHHLVRPNLFNSAYEAAAGFVIGNRITIKQKQVIIKKLSETYGGEFKIGAQTFYSFPGPDVLLQINRDSLLNEVKLERLKLVAEAASTGLLTRKHLLSLPVEEALNRLKSIKGIGDFYAQGILFRGAGIVNEITQDDITPYAIQQAYDLNQLPVKTKILEVSKKWHPYKMWSLVLLHIWVRQEVGMPKRR